MIKLNLRIYFLIDLIFIVGGGVEKNRSARPVSKKIKAGNKVARLSIQTGETAQEDAERRKEQNKRTVYVRFKEADKLPKDAQEIRDQLFDRVWGHL
jgi:hypothetical protein